MEPLLWVLAGLVAVLAVTGWVCQRLRLPPALGYLVAGVAIPKTFADESLQDLIHLGEASRIAVLVLLFFIGLELNLGALRKVLAQTRVVSIFNIVVPTLMIAGFARLLGWKFSEALVLGIALSLSSTIFGERLSSGRAFPAEARKRMFGVLLAEDVAAGGLLAILAVLGDATGSTSFLEPVETMVVLVLALLVLAALALTIVPRILDRIAAIHSPELVVLASGAALLLFSAAGEWAGSAELGAFLAGMAAAEAGSRFVVRNALTPLRHIALALFFFASGLLVDPATVIAHWPLVLVCAVLVTIAKVLVHLPSGINAGLGFGDAWRVSFAMSTVGEFSLILVGAATLGGVAHPALGAVVTGTIVALLIVAPLLLFTVPRLERWGTRVPAPVGRAMGAFTQTLRRRKVGGTESLGRGRHVAVLLANLLLVGVVGAAVVALDAFLAERMPNTEAIVRSTLVFGAGLAVQAPLLVYGFRAYRQILLSFLRVAGRPQAQEILKIRIADTLVLTVGLVLGAFVALLLGASWLVALGSLFVAIVIGALAWRQLMRLTGALQGTLARVLGPDSETPVLLEEALHRYGWDLDVLALNLPPHSRVAGRSIGDLRITAATGALVAVVKRGGEEIVNPRDVTRLRGGDTVVLVGDARQLRRAEALLDAGESSVHMAPESRAAAVVDIAVAEDSLLLRDKPTKDALQEEVGVRILGVWKAGREHPSSWSQDAYPEPGDRIIALGTPLHVERLRRRLLPPVAEVDMATEAKEP